MASITRMSAAVVLSLVSFVALILIAPAAAAANIDTDSPSVAPSGGRSGPMALASTGLDITMPVVIGLCTLILGIILVAWAFLRRGSAEHR